MRLIDADALKRLEHYEKSPLEDEVIGWNAAIDFIIECEPTIDAVPVVRCKDCKHGNGPLLLLGGRSECRHSGVYMDGPDSFCSCGKRRTDEAD